MTRPTVSKLVAAATVLVGAFFAGSTLHVRAIAADRYSNVVSPVNSCNSSTACFVEQNSGGGPGLEGASAHGYGSYGITNLNSTRTASAAGVLGYDAATTEFGGNLNAGVQGRSNNGNGVFGVTKHKSMSGAPAAGVYGFDESRDGAPFNYGVWGESIHGTGVFAQSFGYVGVEAIGGGDSSNFAFPALSVVNNNPNPSHLVDACAAAADVPCDHAAPSRVLDLDAAGNLTIAGHLFTSGSCSSGCITSGNGRSRSILSYAGTQTMPSIDDFGEAQLVRGTAYVRLSADFANVIDRATGYLVFITPEDDSRGLYVTGKTRAGFSVRENQNGHSTLAFSYRIIAKPFGANAARLPVEVVRPRAAHAAPLPNPRRF